MTTNNTITTTQDKRADYGACARADCERSNYVIATLGCWEDDDDTHIAGRDREGSLLDGAESLTSGKHDDRYKGDIRVFKGDGVAKVKRFKTRLDLRNLSTFDLGGEAESSRYPVEHEVAKAPSLPSLLYHLFRLLRALTSIDSVTFPYRDLIASPTPSASLWLRARGS